MEMQHINGDRALAWGAIEAGVSIVTGYPGSPGTGTFNALFETAQDHGGPLDQIDVVVVVMFPADGDDVACNFRARIRIPSRPERVRDEMGSLAGRNEKEVVAEVLDRCVRPCRVGKGAEAARHAGVAAGGLGGR